MRVDGRDKTLMIDEDTSKQLNELFKQKKEKTIKEDDDKYIDYESIPILKKYKINCLESILKDQINRKYKISFYKGIQMVLETMVLFVLMLSICMKANIFSIVYLIFIIRYITSKAKTQLLVHIVVYITICFLMQYFLFLLNLTSEISP